MAVFPLFSFLRQAWLVSSRRRSRRHYHQARKRPKKRDGGSFGAKDYMPKEELVTVLFTLKTLPPAQKELDKMDKDQVQKIYDHIEQLKIDPFR